MVASESKHLPETEGGVQRERHSLTRRIILTIFIVGGVLILMVLPMTLLFYAPERFAGLAASGIVVSVAMYLLLNRRRRLIQLQEKELDEE